MDQNTFRSFLKRYIDGTISPAEWDQLSTELGAGKHDEAWQHAVGEALKDKQFKKLADPDKKDILFRRILEAAAEEKEAEAITNRRGWVGFRAAAVLLLLVAGAWLWFRQGTIKAGPDVSPVALQNKDDRAPGGNKAVLILADGQKIGLDSTRKGAIARQGATRVYNQNGLLSYAAETRSTDAKVLYNMIKTPRGGEYEVLLPDSTRVWLNAVSSLRFPTRFAGGERQVTVTGEAYFEVAGHPDKPFKVEIAGEDGSKKGSVEVLGTHFNINAYDENPTINTTLLEGKVRVSDHKTTMELSPGEQAIQQKDGDMVLKKNVNTQASIAWKNGVFMFNDAGIKSVMRQLARWYDIDVQYAHDNNIQLSGMISRNTNLSQVLKMLELTRVVHFKVEGKKITVE
jgi:ferric-dicitrate binding protein FerR (iron transport regulator)